MASPTLEMMQNPADKNIMGNITERWRVLSGNNNWEGLLEPLDNDLHGYLIHYGEMAQATGDAFNNDKISKYAALGRKDIVIVWRVSIQTSEWFGDLDFIQVSAPIIFGEKSDPKLKVVASVGLLFSEVLIEIHLLAKKTDT
ncbi:hypothetical protein HAX54_018815 [Datura stramonium]|uniref:Phospholipase A1 n=1 Tax=Datura stramonium TaxID=4076 RepID=A0ABS8UN67_DATST|nr:hypothetical protein [Datura stramonium]